MSLFCCLAIFNVFVTEIHAAAKETVALAEQRFMSNQHEWQFDNAWQEMLNHATIKVIIKIDLFFVCNVNIF